VTLSREQARELVENFGGRAILVVGDLMLDRYIYGEVDRISPEAPVPVVRVRREEDVPGGASNVAWNIVALGGRAAVSGVLGEDAPGEALRGLLRDGGVDTGGVVSSAGRGTTVKTRIIGEHQQVVRVDWDAEGALEEDLRGRLAAAAVAAVADCHGVIIEDYGKGVVCREVVAAVLAAARRAGVPVGLDPKESHELDLEGGVTVATPNRREVFVAAGMYWDGRRRAGHPLEDDFLMEAVRRVAEKWRPEMLLVTLGPDGMLLVERGGGTRHIPTRAREVYDVSGAGDTVIATSLLALAAGAGHVAAAELANHAAGVVVGKMGTSPCTREELLESLSDGWPG